MKRRSGGRVVPPSPVKPVGKPAKPKLPKGALRDVKRMPREILLSICGFADFKSLVQLSRTNRDLRDLTRHPAQHHLWTSAAEREGLPEPPKRLDWYRFGALFAQEHCNGCGKKAGTMDWGLRILCCTKCEDTLLLKSIPPERSYLMACLLESRREPKGRTSFYHTQGWTAWVKADYDALAARLEDGQEWAALENVLEPMGLDALHWSTVDYTLIDRMTLKFIIDEDDEERFAQGMRTYKKRQEELVVVSKTSTRRSALKRTSIPLLCQLFLSDISIRGYFIDSEHDERDWLPVMDDNSIQKCEELTEKKWQTLQPKLDELVNANKLRREAHAERQRLLPLHAQIAPIWRQHCDQLDLRDPIMPTLGDVFAAREVQNLLKSEHKTDDGKLKPAHINTAIDAITAGLPDWRDNVQQEVDNFAAEALEEDLVGLACFGCLTCQATLAWPTLLRHVCIRTDPDASKGFRPKGNARNHAVPIESIVIADAFRVDKLEVEVDATLALAALAARSALAEVLDLDGEPLIHTVLDAMGARFQVGAPPDPESHPITWQQVRHEVVHEHWRDEGATIRVASVAEVRAMRMAVERQRILDNRGMAVWLCPRCPASERPAMKRDTADKHQLMCPKKGVEKAVVDEGKMRELIAALPANILEAPPPPRQCRGPAIGAKYRWGFEDLFSSRDDPW